MELMIDFKTLDKGSHLVLEPHDKEFLNVPNPKVIWNSSNSKLPLPKSGNNYKNFI